MIALAMAVRDLLGALVTTAVAHGRGLLAGACDAGCDVATVLSVGVTAVVTADHGLSSMTLLAFAALIGGSVVGTVLGVRMAVWLACWFGPLKAAV